MTSDRKIKSNRINGRRGRGPRTVAGKARSNRNALSHGLTLSILNEPSMCAEVEKVARAIAGEDSDEFQLIQARIIAMAQADLARIQDVKVRLLNSQQRMMMMMPPASYDKDVTDFQTVEVASDCNNAFRAGLPEQIEIVPNLEILKQVVRLERYQTAAISRRRRAMRAFLTHRNV